MTRLLIVEDDAATAHELQEGLGARGYEPGHAGSVEAAEPLVTEGNWDALIVDRMLPGRDGLDFVRSLRERGFTVPVLILTALGTVDDRILGLRAGGDDYLVKPFALGEVVARIEALLRRPTMGMRAVLRAGSVELDLIARTARRGGRDLELLPREFQLLEYFVRREGQVVTPALLLRDVWNYNFELRSNLVDVQLGRLRRKLDRQGETRLITNVRGVGFIFRADP
jgi:two-component system, OmpR family, response regulator